MALHVQVVIICHVLRGDTDVEDRLSVHFSDTVKGHQALTRFAHHSAVTFADGRETSLGIHVLQVEESVTVRQFPERGEV